MSSKYVVIYFISVTHYRPYFCNNLFFMFFIRTGRECCVESPSPDNALIKHLATVYSSAQPLMRSGNACPPEHFNGGITNGAQWYEVEGMWFYSLYICENLKCLLRM
jgi:hypothetical protein